MIRTVPSCLYFPPDLTLCLVNKLAFLGNDQWMSHVLTRTKAFQRRQRSTEGRSIIPGQALLYRISIFLFLDCISVLATLHSIHTPVLLPGKSPGQRNLVGCSPWGHKESDMTEQLHLHFSFHALEKEMATHSSVLAWRIPGTGEPGGLLSMGLHSRTWLKWQQQQHSIQTK